MTDQITLSKDMPGCPMCGAPLVKTGTHDRICNSCGLTCKVFTPEDELDAEADRVVRSRQYAGEAGRSTSINPKQTRW